MDQCGRYLFTDDFSKYRVSARLGSLRFLRFISHVGAGRASCQRRFWFCETLADAHWLPTRVILIYALIGQQHDTSSSKAGRKLKKSTWALV